MSDNVAGWNWLWNSRKWHYFENGRSLCGKWGLLGGNQDAQEHVSEDVACRVCARKLAKREATHE